MLGFVYAVRSASANREDALMKRYPWGWVREPRWKKNEKKDLILFWLWSSLELSQFLTSNRLQMLLRTLTLHRLFYSSVCVRVCVRATSSECYSGSVSGVNQLVTLVWSAGIWVEINICALCSRSSILISVCFFFWLFFLFHSDWKQMCGGCLAAVHMSPLRFAVLYLLGCF